MTISDAPSIASEPEPESSTNTEEDSAEMIQKVLPIRMVSKVVPGFGRGSKDLGIPTANLSSSPADMQCKISFDSLPTGIYYGFARMVPHADDDANVSKNLCAVESLHGVHKAAISIGYNPCYKNEHKTIEPHLIAPPNHPARKLSACGETQFQDLYDAQMRLSIVGYLRPELPFEGLDKLIVAIKDDIVKTEKLCDDPSSATVVSEKDWVSSSESVL
jgi:riboflavin kinase